MEKFVISKNSKGEFKYEFLDYHEQLIFSKSGYKNKITCLKVIESIKRNSQEDSRFYRKRTATNKCYFNLKSANGQILGISEIYADKTTREEIIQFVKITSVDATIEDFSKRAIKASLETVI